MAASAPQTTAGPSSLLTELQAQHDLQQMLPLFQSMQSANARQLQPHLPSMRLANSAPVTSAAADNADATAVADSMQTTAAAAASGWSPNWSPRVDWSALLKSPSHDAS